MGGSVSVLKEAFFSAVKKTFWTKKVRERCNHPIDMKVGAFESLSLEVTFEYPSYGSATQRKFSTGD